MSEGAGVRVQRQPERLHPGNHLKNLNKALLVVNEEPESAESQEGVSIQIQTFSGEIFLRTSYTQCNNGKNKRRPETIQVKFYRDSDSAESKELSVGWLDLVLQHPENYSGILY